MRSRFTLLAGALALTACSDVPDRIAGPAPNKLATSPQGTVTAQDMRDRYIVVFRDDVANPHALSDQLVAAAGGTVHYRYAYAIKGFAATLPASALAGIARHPNVVYVVPDGIASISASGTDNTVSSWGLDRIDQRDLPLGNSYHWDHDGGGVRAYILDTGIRTAHNEFGGRASVGFDAVGDGQNGQDCHGHGTHVAGTVGGAEYGVARAVNLVAVRVLGCSGSGSWSGVVAGIDWVRQNAVKPAVANMSLGGSLNSAVNSAVTNAVNSGVVFAVAAGNSSADACGASPASTPNALTVGSTTISDARSSFSNFGTCVDLFAPGSSITSAWNSSNTASNTISGTSMASPHVAGVAALYLSANTNASPSAVESAIEGAATTGKVTSPGSGSPNLLLHSIFGGGSPPPPPGSIVLSAVGYKVKGLQKANLGWTGASGPVDVYRGTSKIASSVSSPFTDHINVRGGGSYTYKVCPAGSSSGCSNNASVTF